MFSRQPNVDCIRKVSILGMGTIGNKVHLCKVPPSHSCIVLQAGILRIVPNCIPALSGRVQPNSELNMETFQIQEASKISHLNLLSSEAES